MCFNDKSSEYIYADADGEYGSWHLFYIHLCVDVGKIEQLLSPDSDYLEYYGVSVCDSSDIYAVKPVGYGMGKLAG